MIRLFSNLIDLVKTILSFYTWLGIFKWLTKRSRLYRGSLTLDPIKSLLVYFTKFSIIGKNQILNPNSKNYLSLSKKSSSPIWYAVALPKSASSNIASMVSRIQVKMHGAKRRSYASWMQIISDSGLRCSLLTEFPKGVLIKHHPLFIGSNLNIIEALNIKIFIIIRHPADQIINFLNHCVKGDKKNEKFIFSSEEKLVIDPIFPFDKSIVDLYKKSQDLGVQSLIKSGYLLNTIMFIQNWLRYTKKLSKKKFMVLQFEKYVKDPSYYRSNFKDFLDFDLGEEFWQNEIELQTSTKKESISEHKKMMSDYDSSIITHFSGEVSIFEKLVNEKTKEIYNDKIAAIYKVQSLDEISQYYNLYVN